MRKIQSLLLLAALIGTVSAPAFANGLVVCEKGVCAQQILNSNTSSFLNAIKNLLQSNPNARIDLCDADPHTHQCVNNAIYWQASTDTTIFNMALANARVSVSDNDVSLDYLLAANNAYPRCDFSPIELSALTDRRVRIVSSAYNCDLMETEPTNLQKIFLVDFIDVDSRVLGGTYQVQTGGALRGQHVGYALMQFRDAATPLPLVPPKYSNVAPKVPPANVEPTSDELFAEQQSWWDSVKVDWGRVCNALQGQTTCTLPVPEPVTELPQQPAPAAEPDLSLEPTPVFVAPPVEGLSETTPEEKPVVIEEPKKVIEPAPAPVIEKKPEPTPVPETSKVVEPKDLSLEPVPVFVAPRIEEPEPVKPEPVVEPVAPPKPVDPPKPVVVAPAPAPAPVQVPAPQPMPVATQYGGVCPMNQPCAPAVEPKEDEPWYSSVKQAFMSVLYLDPIK